MSVEELVKRLRDSDEHIPPTRHDIWEAADKLEELAAEVERLKSYSVEMLHRKDEQFERAESAEAALAEAKRENEALREAGLKLMPYLRWTIGPESLGHHPTMPSAVSAFLSALAQEADDERS